MIKIVMTMVGIFAASFAATTVVLFALTWWFYQPAPPTTPSAQEGASAPAEEPEVELEPDTPADSRDRVRSTEPPPQ